MPEQPRWPGHWSVRGCPRGGRCGSGRGWSCGFHCFITSSPDTSQPRSCACATTAVRAVRGSAVEGFVLSFCVSISGFGHPSVLWLLWGASGPSAAPFPMPPGLLVPSGFILLDCLYLELRSPCLSVCPCESSGTQVAPAHAKMCLGRGRGCGHRCAALVLLPPHPQLSVSLSLQCIVRILPRALRKAR